MGEQPDVKAVSVGQLLADSGLDRISILKMDIERSEIQVFKDSYVEWLDKCDVIVIELHDQVCEEVFHCAIGHGTFDISRSGELTVCIRKKLREQQGLLAES